MGRRRWWWLTGAALLAVAPTGCAHSEDEWQAQLRTIGDLKSNLDAEQAQAKKARADLDESTTKMEQLKQQLNNAGVDVAKLDATLETQARAAEDYRRRGELVEATRRRLELLRSKLAPLRNQGLTVTVRNNRVTLQLPGDVLFDAGHETLKHEGRAMLLRIAEVIRGDPTLKARAYQVTGHVDGASAGGRLKDPVGRSLARAREVLAVLLQPTEKGGGGLGPDRWSAAGYGDADPLRSNDTPDGKQANRRCEIVVQPGADEVLDLRALTP
jgi:chemotaxis protein MotB